MTPQRTARAHRGSFRRPDAADKDCSGCLMAPPTLGGRRRAHRQHHKGRSLDPHGPSCSSQSSSDLSSPSDSCYSFVRKALQVNNSSLSCGPLALGNYSSCTSIMQRRERDGASVLHYSCCPEVNALNYGARLDKPQFDITSYVMLYLTTQKMEALLFQTCRKKTVNQHSYHY